MGTAFCGSKKGKNGGEFYGVQNGVFDNGVGYTSFGLGGGTKGCYVLVAKGGGWEGSNNLTDDKLTPSNPT